MYVINGGEQDKIVSGSGLEEAKTHRKKKGKKNVRNEHVQLIYIQVYSMESDRNVLKLAAQSHATKDLKLRQQRARLFSQTPSSHRKSDASVCFLVITGTCSHNPEQTFDN